MSSESTALPRVASGTESALTRHYGWVMVVVAAVAMVATLPGRTHGLGMITERLLADPSLQLTRVGYGQLNFWATLIGSLFCFGIGGLIDRYSLRVVLSVTMIALGAVVVAMAQTSTIAGLFVAVLLTRGLGQSALSVISITTVGKWFDRNVTFPMAVYAVLMAGGFIAIALISRNYAEVNWRDFWSTIGWGVIAAGLFAGVIARDRPAGTPILTANDPAIPDAPALQREYSLTEALKTPIFWVCSLSISLFGLVVSGVSLFNESILTEQGFAREVYYESLALGTAVGLVAKMMTGWLGRSWPVNRLLVASLTLLTVSLIWLPHLVNYRDVVGYVLLNATAGGMLTVLFFSVWPALFGRLHLGKIQGVAQMLTVVASAFGPLLFASVHERTGSYAPLLYALAASTAGLALAAGLTPLPSSAGENAHDAA